MNTTSKQIVLAEDNAADVLLVRQALGSHEIDCDLRLIGDGEEAFAFIDPLDADGKIPCPDLVLLDLHLPRLDDNEILKRLRASERCRQMPVIVLTASDSPQDHARAHKHAVVEYFEKPTDLEEFMHLEARVKDIACRSAQAAGRGAKQKRNSADLDAPGESVVRELRRSAQAAGRGAKRKRISADLAAAGESVVRELLESPASKYQL